MDKLNDLVLSDTNEIDKYMLREIINRLFIIYASPLFFGIPFIGTPLDVIYTEIQQNRLKIFINNSIDDLKENKLDKSYLESPEFINFLKETMRCVADEIHEDKIIYYAKLFKNSLTVNKQERRYNFSYLKILNELTVEELLLLKEIYFQQKDLEEISIISIKNSGWNDLPVIMKDKYEIEEEDLTFLLKRLESTGLITEFSGTIVGYEGNIFKITPSMVKMIEKLELCSE